MFTWLTKILGFGGNTTTVTEDVKPTEPVKAEVSTSTPKKSANKTSKKAATKKSGKTCDFDKLNKTQLLAEAKHRGIKANASLSKAELLERVKNG